MNSASYFSNAKLNLTLQVFPSRSDGYHPIRSIFQEISLSDELIFSKLPSSDQFVLHCDHPGLQKKGDNLLTRVYRSIQSRLHFGIEIVLNKKIPLGAGLGGGSSNVAVFLKYLCDEGVISAGELFSLALQFGSDVPFFLQGGQCLVEGVGEKITPSCVDVSGFFVLIYPGFPVSTPDAYRWFDLCGQTTVVSSGWSNDLKYPVFEHETRLKEMESTLVQELGVDQLYMSGSGSTVFLPFQNKEKASQVADSIQASYASALVYVVSPIFR